MKRLIESFRRWFKPDPFLFFTHTPRYIKVGDVFDGAIITKVELQSYTPLVGGGVAPCYKVYGVKK